MRFHGSRRARAISLGLALLLLLLLGRAVVQYYEFAQRRLLPTLIGTLEDRLQRRLAYDRVDVSRPGRLVVEGLRVSRGREWSDGRLLTVSRAELRYNPLLAAWQTYWFGPRLKGARATLHAEGIEIQRPLPFPPGRTLKAAAVDVEADLGALLRGSTDPLPGVGRVVLTEPEFSLTRLPDRSWDLERLLRQGSKKPTSFRGVLQARSARAKILDFVPGSLPAPALNAVSADFQLDYAAYPLVRFQAEGAVLGGRGGRARVVGYREARTRRWYAAVDGASGALPYWFRYFVRNPGRNEVRSGGGTVHAVVWDDKKVKDRRPDFRVTLQVEGGGGKLAAIPEALSDFAGEVVAEPDVVRADGRGRVAGMPVRASGWQTFAANARTGDWRVESSQANVRGLQAVFPRLVVPTELRVARPLRVAAHAIGRGDVWRATGQVNARSVRFERVTAPQVDASFTGVFSGAAAPRVTGTYRIPQARLPDFGATDGVGTFQSTDELIHTRARFAALGGGVSLDAWLAPRDAEPRFWLEGTADGLDLARAPWKRAGWPVSGRMSGSFVASGTRQHLEVTADVASDGVQVKNEHLAGLSGRVRYEEGRLVVESARAQDPRGVVTAHGEVRLEPLTLALVIEGRGLDVARWTAGRYKESVGGTAWGRLKLTGTPDEPDISGAVQVYQPRWRDQAADYVEANVRTDARESVQLSSLKLLRGSEQARAERLVLSRKLDAGPMAPWQMGGEMDVDGLSVNRALALATPITPGAASARPALAGDFERLHLTLQGTTAAPQVSVEAVVRGASIRRFDLGEIRFTGRLDGAANRLTVSEARVRGPLGEAITRGEVRAAAEGPAETRWERAALAWQGTVSGLPLGRALREAAPDAVWRNEVAGAASATVEVGGTAGAPVVRLSDVRLSDVRIAGVAAQAAPFTALWSGGSVVARDLRVDLAAGSLRAPWLAFRAAEDKAPARLLLGQATVERVPLRSLVAIADRYPLPPADATRYDRGRDALDRWVDWAGAELTGHLGPAQAEGVSDAEILGRLTAQVEPAEIRGDLRATGFRLEVGGGPQAEASAQFTLAAGRQELRMVKVTTQDGTELEGFGLRRDVGAGEAQIQFAGRLRGFDLTALDRLPDRAWVERVAALQPLRGRADLTFGVTGTQAQPEATFSAVVREPVIAGVPLDLAECRGGAYSAARSRVEVQDLRLEARGRQENAQLRAAGYLPLAWPELTVPPDAPRDLTVSLPRQSLDTLTDLAARARTLAGGLDDNGIGLVDTLTTLFGAIVVNGGTVEGNVRLAGTAAAPDNSGSLTLVSDLIRVRARPEFRPNGKPRAAGAAPELLETGIKDFRMRAEVQGDTMRLIDFGGSSTYGGGFTGGGTLTFGAQDGAPTRPRAAFSLSVDAFRFVEGNAARLLGEGFQNAGLRGTLQTADNTQPRQARPLRVAGVWPNLAFVGALRVDDATLPLGFDNAGAGQLAALPDVGSLNLGVLVGKNVWVRNPLARIQLEPSVATAGRTDGALLITNRLPTPVVAGTLRAGGGTFNLPLLRLRNVEGTVRVAYDGRVAHLAPTPATPVYLDLTGEASLRIQRSPVLEAEYYDATFEIRGTPGAGGAAGFRPAGVETALAIGAEGGLTVTVRTDPPLPSAEIEALIRQQYAAEGFATGGANVVEALRGQIEQAFAVNVASEFTGRVEDVLRSALGLSIFSVEFGVQQPLRIRLGKQIFGPLYGTISQSFGATELQTQRRYEVYYRVSPQFRVGYREEEPLGRKVFFISGTAAF